MKEIAWGPEIAINGMRPDWLDPQTWVNGRIAYRPVDGYEWQAGKAGWRDFTKLSAIRLPADHPHYATRTHPAAPTPSEVGPEVVERMIALVRGIVGGAANNGDANYLTTNAERAVLAEARAIVALLHEPVDADLVEARKAVSEMSIFSDHVDAVLAGRWDDSPIVVATLDAIRGRALAAGDR